MTDQTEPVRKSLLPCTPPPEWELNTVLGARTGDDGCAVFPGDRGRVVVRRRITYGDWEPVHPDHWADEPPTPVASSAADDWPSRRTGLRDQLAAAIWERQNPGRRYADCEHPWQAEAEEDVDAVLAVLYREWPWLQAEAEDAVPQAAGEYGQEKRLDIHIGGADAEPRATLTPCTCRQAVHDREHRNAVDGCPWCAAKAATSGAGTLPIGDLL